MTKWQRFKHELANVRRHWKLFGLLAIMGFICYQMFVANYTLVSPIVRIGNQDSYTTIWNERAMCLTELDQIKAKQANTKGGDNYDYAN